MPEKNFFYFHLFSLSLFPFAKKTQPCSQEKVHEDSYFYFMVTDIG